jgi:hypothetical protein
MKKGYISLGLCLLLALAALKQDSVAQMAPANDAMSGAGLAEAGEKTRQALMDGDYKTLYGMMDVAAVGQMALLQEKFIVALDESGMSDEDAKKFAEQLDQRGEFAIQGVNGLRNLTEVEFFGLMSGILTSRTARPVENAALRWHLVGKGVGVQEPRNKKLRRMAIMNWVGGLVYSNRKDESVSLLFTLDGKDWKLTYYEVDAKGADFDFAKLLEYADKWDKVSFKWTGTSRARMAEGEQLLGSVRDATRVQYSKTGVAPKKISDFQKLASFEGEYYAIEDTVYKVSDQEAAVFVKPGDAADAWGLLVFEWASGNSSIEWFETEADRDGKVQELADTAKKKKDAEGGK